MFTIHVSCTCRRFLSFVFIPPGCLLICWPCWFWWRPLNVRPRGMPEHSATHRKDSVSPEHTNTKSTPVTIPPPSLHPRHSTSAIRPFHLTVSQRKLLNNTRRQTMLHCRGRKQRPLTTFKHLTVRFLPMIPNMTRGGQPFKREKYRITLSQARGSVKTWKDSSTTPKIVWASWITSGKCSKSVPWNKRVHRMPPNRGARRRRVSVSSLDLPSSQIIWFRK